MLTSYVGGDTVGQFEDKSRVHTHEVRQPTAPAHQSNEAKGIATVVQPFLARGAFVATYAWLNGYPVADLETVLDFGSDFNDVAGKLMT